MSKEYNWTVEIAGKSHIILCEVTGNQYVIYADDDHIKTVYRKQFQNARGGIDEEIEIFGQPCRFVVWNEKPDIIVDGQMVTAQGSYEDTMRKYKKVMLAYSYVMLVIALAAITSYCVLSFGGKNMSSWTQTFIFAIAIGVFSILGIRKYRK